MEHFRTVGNIRHTYSVLGLSSNEEVWWHYSARNGKAEFGLPGKDLQRQLLCKRYYLGIFD